LDITDGGAATVAADGGPVTLLGISTAPGNGTSSINAVTGEITYTPNSGYNGNDSFRYRFTDSAGTTFEALVNVNISGGIVTPIVVTVTASSFSKVYGNTDPTFGYTTNNPNVSLTGSLSRAPGETVGSYNITQGTLACVTSNCNISYVPGTLAITQRAITLSADAASKTYGNADPTLGVSITGGSLGSVSVSDTLADVTGTPSRQTGENVGSYDIALGSGAKASNY
jgi:hypothetical protein